MLAAALLNHADDEGYFNANPGLVKAACCPLREPSVSIQDGLKRLASIGYLRFGAGLDGRRYGHVVTFDDHQRVNRPTASKIKALGLVWEGSELTHAQLTDSSPQERKGKEQGKEDKSLCAPAEAAALPKSYPIPYQAIADLYNQTMTGLPKVRELTAKRKALIRSCWLASKHRQRIGFFASYFPECQDDNFLNGTGPYTNGHENWRPSFDYLLRQDVVTKVYERAMQQVEERDA